LGVEIGSSISPLSMKDLSNETVELVATPQNMVILYQFEYSSKSKKILADLIDAASSVGGISAFGITRQIPAEDRYSFGAFSSRILVDDKNATAALGMSRSSPAVAILGPGNHLLAVLDEPASSVEMVLAVADVFLANGFPDAAERCYRVVPPEIGDETAVQMCRMYSAILRGDVKTAQAEMKEWDQKSASPSADLPAARAFLLFCEGNTRRALAECQKAPENGFAQWVKGLALSRMGECAAASAAFHNAVKSRLSYRWQKVAAFVSAAQVSEAEGKPDAALALHKKAFDLAPLNPVNTACLVNYYWQQNKIPAASAYAGILQATTQNELVRSFISEFEKEVIFIGSTAAREAVFKKIKKNEPAGAKPAGTRNIVVSDFFIQGCPSDSGYLACAASAYLTHCLERSKKVSAVRRAAVKEAARVMGIAERRPIGTEPLRKIALALSADLLVVGEIGSYEDFYLINVRVANVHSGEIVAIISDRFPTLEGVAPAIERASDELLKKLKLE